MAGAVAVSQVPGLLRELAISPVLSAHLESYLRPWWSNSGHLLFATRNGTPWLADLVLKRKLHPLLKRLGIAQCGFTDSAVRMLR